MALHNILITGAAGFIGHGLALRLLAEGRRVVGLDNLNDYYDVQLKRDRLANLHKFDNKLQAQLERYLVKVGILHKGQTLSAQELPPSEDVIDASPVFGN